MPQWGATIGLVDEYGVFSSIIDLDALKHLIVVNDVQLVTNDGADPRHVYF